MATLIPSAFLQKRALQDLSGSLSTEMLPHERDGLILGRHAWRRRHKIGGIAHVLEKLYVRSRSLFEKHVA